MKPLISIIIPCYNSGEFLPDALDSIKNCKGDYNYENIIVNDGSTDIRTLNLLSDLSKKDYIIINQENKGAAAARNTGAKHAKGEFLLLLDSDNKIRPAFITDGVKFFLNDNKLGVLYGKADFFGEKIRSRHFVNKEFSISRLLTVNCIDMCSIIRKSVWDELGGLDEKCPPLEDWEFWIRVYKSGWKFLYLDQIFFDYRMRKNSLMGEHHNNKTLAGVREYIFLKHIDLFIDNYFIIADQMFSYEEDVKKPLRSFFKYAYYKYFKSK